MDFTAFQVLLLDGMNLVQELDDLYQELARVYHEPIQDNIVMVKMILEILIRSRAFAILCNYLLDYISRNTTIGLHGIDMIQILTMIKDEIEVWHQICLTYNGPALAPNSYLRNFFHKTKRIMELLYQSRVARIVWNWTPRLARFIYYEGPLLISRVREITWLTMTFYRAQILHAFCVLKIAIFVIVLCLLIYYGIKFIIWMIGVFRQRL